MSPVRMLPSRSDSQQLPSAVLEGFLEELAEDGSVKPHGFLQWSQKDHVRQTAQWALREISRLRSELKVQSV